MKKIISIILFALFLLNSTRICAFAELDLDGDLYSEIVVPDEISDTNTNTNINTDVEKVQPAKSAQTKTNMKDAKPAVITLQSSEGEVGEKLQNVTLISKQLSKKVYKQPTIYKHYVPYEITVNSANETPILMTIDTEINFVKDDGSVISSPTRREIYMRTRKRDRGRHYACQIPGILVGTVVSVGTFLMGTPIGYGIYKAMQVPVTKAARTNVHISQDLYSAHGLPLRIEPNTEYVLYFYVPKKTDVKSILIKNVSYNNAIYDIEIPLGEVL